MAKAKTPKVDPQVCPKCGRRGPITLHAAAYWDVPLTKKGAPMKEKRWKNMDIFETDIADARCSNSECLHPYSWGRKRFFTLEEAKHL